MQQIGLDGYKQLISRDVALARSLQAKICARDDFELVAAGPLSVTCFLYTPQGAADVEAINRRLVPIVQCEGQVFLTGHGTRRQVRAARLYRQFPHDRSRPRPAARRDR